MQAATSTGRDQTIARRTGCYCQRGKGMIHGMRVGIIFWHGHPIFQTIDPVLWDYECYRRWYGDGTYGFRNRAT